MALARNIVMSFEKLSDEEQLQVHHALDDWQTNYEGEAMDPSITERIIDGVFLKDVTLQYCAGITSNLAEFFMCRQRDCLWVCEPVQWIKRVSSEHFRRAKCIHEYQPWSGIGDVIPTQKLMVAHQGDAWRAWPCEWVDSNTTQLQNRLKEIWNKFETELRGLKHEDIVKVFQEKARMGQRPFFQDHTFDKQHDVDELNKHGIKNAADPWTYGHLEGDGKLKGFHFKYSDTDAVLSFDDVIRLWGYAKYMLEYSRARSRM